MIINLLSGPRNISTALMYSFAQRQDTKVVDEPFYSYYLVKTDVDHPGKQETIMSMSSNHNTVIQEIESMHDGNHLFLKNMSHHMLMDDYSFVLDWKNFFLVRDPKQLISSFIKVIPNPTMDDIGLQKEWELFQYLQENGNDPVVLDSNEILKNPRKVLSEVCDRLGIPFLEEMLSWNKGSRPEDGVWAKYWYHNVHNSTGFAKQRNRTVELPENLHSLHSDAKHYFDLLSEHSIKA